MLPGKKFTAQDAIGIAKRRWWMVVVPAMIGIFAGLMVSAKARDTYKSEMLIQIVPQQVPDRFIPNTVTEKTENRMDALQAQVTSRSQLEQLIREFSLYPEMLAVAPMEDVANRMRNAIEVDKLRPDRMSPVNAFYVRFTYDDADKAAKVTSRLGGVFVDKNSSERVKSAESTSEFLGKTVADAKAKLESHEEKMEKFRQQNSGRLPTQADFNLQAIQTTQSNLQAIIESSARDRDRKLILERLYADALQQPAPMSTAAVNAAERPQDPSSTATLPVAQQLDLAKANLARLEQRLTPEHPDLKRARGIMADLSKKAEDERQRAAATPGTSPVTASPGVTVEQSNRRERLSQMRAEIDTLTGTITFKENEERRLRGIVSDYQSRLEGTPGVESEWISLTRDYDTLTTSYRDLLTKSENSKVATDLERRNVGEQFRVLDPARVPVRPVGPFRLQINGIGLGVGLAIGLITVAFLELRNMTFRSESDVMDTLALPVLAMVPLVQTASDLQRLNRNRLLISAIALLGFVSAGVVFWSMQLWKHVS